MRILWIDDDSDVQKEQDWFGNILEQHEVQSISDFEEATDKISNQLEQYDLIVIDINLLKQEESISAQVQQDAARFDISPQEYLQEAGFHLYLKLLAQGFEQERIVFMTGNVDSEDVAQLIKEFKATFDPARYKELHKKLRAKMSSEERQEFDGLVEEANKTSIFTFLDRWHQDQKKSVAGKFVEELKSVITDSRLEDDKKSQMVAFVEKCKQVDVLDNDIHNIYNRFEKRFTEARLIPPKAIKKSPITEEVADKLQKWLQQFCERRKDNQLLYDYLTLRRGILNVVSDILGNTDIEIADDFHDLDKGTFLNGIVWLLRDFRISENQYSDVYFALCDYLSKPYERFGRELDKDEECHVKLPLVRLRNWISHGLIEGSQTQFSAQEAGFTFLMAMKSMFNQESYGQHDELKQLYPQESPTHQDILADLVRMYQSQYRDKYAHPLDVIYRKTQKENTKKGTGNKNWKNENYILNFYAAYLFSATKQTNPHYDGKKQSYPRNVKVDKFHPSLIQVCYYYELKETPFNGIAIQQLRQQLKNNW
jgi:CheY-like chemotaxis protein